MNLFAELFISAAAFVVGITVVAIIIGAVALKDIPDEQFKD